MDEAEAQVKLLELEAAVERAPHEALGIALGTGVIEASVAFVTAATIYHPRRFAGLSQGTIHRASQAFARLRATYHAYLTLLAQRPLHSRRPGNQALRRSHR